MSQSIKALSESKNFQIALAVVLVAVGLCCIFANGFVAKITFYSALNEKAMGLVDDALARDQITFLTISAIKAGMALIEGSTVGVGFALEVGDIIQPAYDYVDFFWKVFLYAFLVMGFYKILLETGLLNIGITLIGIGAILWAVTYVAKERQRLLRIAGKRFILMGILIAYVAPLALLLTNALSERYTTKLKEKHYEGIQAFQVELDTAKTRITALSDEISIFRPGESLEQIQLRVVSVANSVAEAFRLSFMAFLFYVLLILFDLLFFPLLSALILYKFASLAVSGLLQGQISPIKVEVVSAPAPSES